MRRRALLVVILLCCGLAACGSKKTPDFTREPALDEAPAPKPPAPKRKAPAPRPVPPPQPEAFDPPPLVNGEAPTL